MTGLETDTVRLMDILASRNWSRHEVAMRLDAVSDEDMPLLARLHEEGRVRLVGMPGEMPFVEILSAPQPAGKPKN
ncbi:hypothetical protein [Aureimonas frigidaquae]|uniref:Uncharacterized protein n=1 Tax=Aureimonas frigidaquae TaxID=424757 RepID=A0A0P0Z3M9_9HYPH|nr:hypothetical protein [Aureimonas frigidaquae]BAT28711.1 hypothetical protein [Aureimonas frigidaquae]